MITTNKEPKDIFLKLSPWGLLFAEHSNLKAGYFSQERYLVTKYLKEKLNILIIGSGNGREAFPVCHDGHRIVCMDTGLLYLMAGKQFFAKENVRNIYFVQADMAQFPFNEKSFDFIFFSLY